MGTLRSSRHLLLAAVTLVGLSPACGEGQGSDPSPVAVVAKALCARLYDCRVDYGFAFDDVAACERLNTACDSRLAGSLERAQRCAGHLAELECEAVVLRWWPEDCTFDPRIPTAGEGEQCEEGVLCETGTHCDWSQGQCGVCVPLGREGDACRAFHECASARCVDGECVPPGHAGDSCANHRECLGKCQEGACVDTAAGAACQSALECATRQTCRGGTCVEAFPYKLGEPCQDDCEVCVSDGLCHAGHLICVEGQCALPPAEGAACDDYCRPGQVCLDGICTAFGGCGESAIGAPCSFSGDCHVGLLCIDDRCAEPAGQGEPCLGPLLVNGGCEPGTYCEIEGTSSRCRARKAEGDACGRDSECRSGLCGDDDRCVETSCR